MTAGSDATGPRFSSAGGAFFDGESPDGRLHSPSAERNVAPLCEALRPWFTGRTGAVVEIGCGSGQHAAHLAATFPGLTWQPTDPDQAHRTSAMAWRDHAGVTNIRDAVALDATTAWSDLPEIAALSPVTAVFSANVIHISPWAVAEGIVRGAATALKPSGLLLFYGPFAEGGQHTGEGNARFDAALRERDPSWGIRDLDEVGGLAASAGFSPPEVTMMPANNRLVCFTLVAGG